MNKIEESQDSYVEMSKEKVEKSLKNINESNLTINQI